MPTKILTKFGFIKEGTSWILYDVGNSTQVLTTCTVISPLLIAKIALGDSSVYVGWASATYAIILAVISPVPGTMVDYKDKKMKMSKSFLFAGTSGDSGLALPFTGYRVVTVIFTIAMLGCNGSIIFYNTFIVDVCDDERVDKMSTAGHVQGYIGSVLSFLIFVIPFALVTLLGDPETGDLVLGSFTLSYRVTYGLTMRMTVFWWLVYPRPMLEHVKQKNFHEPIPHIV